MTGALANHAPASAVTDEQHDKDSQEREHFWTDIIVGPSSIFTGATGGIGQAVARDLNVEGAPLVLTGHETKPISPI